MRNAITVFLIADKGSLSSMTAAFFRIKKDVT